MSLATNVRTKRVYDPPSRDDGYRVLVTRYWPRGVKREAANEYNTKLAPSKELVHAFKHEGLAWAPYTKRYLAEMQSDEAQAEIARLRDLASTKRITLLCMCEDESRCHRSLLRELIVTPRSRRTSRTQLTSRSRGFPAPAAKRSTPRIHSRALLTTKGK